MMHPMNAEAILESLTATAAASNSGSRRCLGPSRVFDCLEALRAYPKSSAQIAHAVFGASSAQHARRVAGYMRAAVSAGAAAKAGGRYELTDAGREALDLRIAVAS